MLTYPNRQSEVLASLQERDYLREEIAKLREALEKIDILGNGLSMQEDEQGLTSYATLMRCGSIARQALSSK